MHHPTLAYVQPSCSGTITYSFGLCYKVKTRPSGFALSLKNAKGLFYNVQTLRSERGAFFVAWEVELKKEDANEDYGGVMNRTPWHVLTLLGLQRFWAARH